MVVSSPSSRGPRKLETYDFVRGGRVRRTVLRRDGRTSSTTLGAPRQLSQVDAHSAYDLAWLTASSRPASNPGARVVRVVDLFAGCGGLSVGIAEACRSLGLEMQSVLANDIDQDILSIYSANFPEAEIVGAPIESLLDGEIGRPPSAVERKFAKRVGEIDLVIGGPPCQGHSDFNNHTRNNDPKNELYLRMARFCEIVRPKNVIIENVPGVERDRGRVAHRTWERLAELGYAVDSGVLDSSRLGVAQRRKRSITIASLEITPSVAESVESIEVEPRPLRWAIEDLLDHPGETIFDQPPCPNETSRSRMDYLFDHDLYDLPDEQRPDCHRLKDHSYVSVYGRLHWDRPAPTITTGFGVMGRGRFVHPARRRTITPHEAARIQFFPDYFAFGTGPRSLIHKVIGNAVPSKMGYALGVHLLR